MSDTFLSQEEVRELTGVRTGKKGRTRTQLQAQALKKMKIPHYVNAAELVIVVRAVIEGGRAKEPAPAPTWQPALK